MKKRFISFLSGMVVGAVMFGGSVAYASGILADLSNNQIFVDGTLTPMEAYVINGHNYVKLRDIGQAVGFNVFWDDTAKCVQVESDKPYTGIAPTKQEGEKTSGQLHQTDVDAIKKDVVTRTNTLRLNKGVAVLKVNNLLMDAAQVRAMRWRLVVLILTLAPMDAEAIPLQIADAPAKTSTASQNCTSNNSTRLYLMPSSIFGRIPRAMRITC